MAALRSRCGHYIFALWFLLLLSSFFPRLISAVGDWMFTIHGVALVLAVNTGRKKSPSRHHRTNLTGRTFATKARIDNQKKIVKQQYLLYMS